MTDLTTKYEATYGSAAKTYLRVLGGDPDAIIREVEQIESQPEPEILTNTWGLLPDPTPEENVHNLILRDIQTRYFASLSRDAALAIGNALGDLGEFKPCASVDLAYSSATFARAWNAANPEAQPIRLNAGAYFSV